MNFCGFSRDFSQSEAIPATSAAKGKDIRKPPVAPVKCPHPLAPLENTPRPKPPANKYNSTEVRPTRIPKSIANQTISKDCKVMGASLSAISIE